MKENRTNYSVNYHVTSPLRGQSGALSKMAQPLPALDTPTEYAWTGARGEETRRISTRLLSSGHTYLSLVGSDSISIWIGLWLVDRR